MVDAIIYIMRVNVKARTSLNAHPFLDLPDHTGGLDMGKRMEMASAQVEGGFNKRLAALRKAAGFTQVDLAAELDISQRLLAVEKLGVAEKRHVLQLLDAFIERGQLKRKAESRV